ncbi:MAG: hypothetical protein GWP35_05755 [Proteobacteria bacterium]|nr:hypothetical protein [Pseudomonadota bacterium]
MNSLKSEGIQPFIVDGGDWLFHLNKLHSNPLVQKQMDEKAQLLIDAYNRFGTAAACLGEHDMALGLDRLIELNGKMKFPLLCANLSLEDGTKPFSGSTLLESQGRKVLMVGAIQIPNDRFIGKYCPKASFTDPVEAIKSEIARQTEKYDLCIVLGHIDITDVDRLAAEVPEIDVIVEPNSMSRTETTWVNDDIKATVNEGCVMLKPSGQGSEMARADLWLRTDRQPWFDIWNEEAPPGSNIADLSIAALAPHIGRHPGMEKIVQGFVRSTRFKDPGDIDLSFKPVTNFLGATTCSGCHPQQADFWKNTGHADAYQTLVDTGDEFRYDCMPCHVTGYGETFVDAHEPGRWKDVQCESCHGNNPRHPIQPKAFPWPKLDVNKCWACHNPNETRVAFDPAEALPKVSCPPMKRN